ncbi:uncharacterized protein [Rutidosis leptorrhynchoides]|uniref:uncharacterized protein n=1 Tax=Rutidosis leptorrhynchoides TaxID=125765 RepID=UPI003A992F55
MGLAEERDLYEESQLQTLLALLGPISLNNDKGDEIQWVHSVNKVYSVPEGTRIMLVSNLNVEFDWVNVVWSKSIPSKIAIFHWLAIQGGIPVKEVFHFRHCLRDGSDDKCGWCSDIELIDHLLLHCPWSYSIWTAMFKWWNIYWVMPSSVSEFSLDCYKGLGINASKFWSLIGPATYWAIWFARNEVLFNGIYTCWNVLLVRIKYKVFEWLVEAKVSERFQFHVWDSQPWMLMF